MLSVGDSWTEGCMIGDVVIVDIVTVLADCVAHWPEMSYLSQSAIWRAVEKGHEKSEYGTCWRKEFKYIHILELVGRNTDEFRYWKASTPKAAWPSNVVLGHAYCKQPDKPLT